MLPNLDPEELSEDIITKRLEYDSYEVELKNRIYTLYKKVLVIPSKEVTFDHAELLYQETSQLSRYFDQWRGIGYSRKQEFLHSLLHRTQYTIQDKLDKNIKKANGINL